MINKKIIAAAAISALLLLMGCALTVNDPVRNVPIFEPYISVQPASYSYSVSAYTAPPVLKVEVWDWDRLDGTLSYQWYAFDTLEDFYKGDTIEVPGATRSEYTPSLTAAAGTKNYFYAVVTNTNDDAIGDKSASLQSDVAVISFSAAGAPEIPVITQNPSKASYIMGRTSAIAPLEVRAAISSGTVVYQWYKFKIDDGFNADGTPKGTPIPNAFQRTYLPESADLGTGNNYYYVVVSNNVTNPDGAITGTAAQFSMPGIISMGLGEKASAPRIDRQPRDILYFTNQNLGGANTAKLSVGAVSLDGGTLSYQWYSSATATGTGTAIENATSYELLPDMSTTTTGTRYYHAIITNTNENVTGNTTDTITSRTAAVKVEPQGSIPAANAFITVEPETKYQYIRGYGGMETTWGNFFQSDPEDMETMFSPDILGYNMWRIMIPPISTNIEETMTEIIGRSYSNRYYENVKIVNKYNGYVLASPWSPPKDWKSNNSINSGGILMPQYYKQFANYLRSYARHMANNGAPIYAVSIANEPNYAGGYDGCEWTPEEMRDFYKEVGRFTQGVRGFGGGKVTPTVLTVNGESANTPEINHAAMNDPASNAAIDLFARHVYGEQRKVLWQHPNLNGREVWMTEHNINSASSTAYPNDWTWNYVWRFMNDVDLVIRMNNENAFVWWVVKRFYSFIGEGEANTSLHTILPRGWGMAHYSRFSIDTTRIKANVTGKLGSATGPDIIFDNATTANVNNNRFDLDNPSVRVTAFVSGDGGEISLVMWTPTMTDGNGGNALGTAQIQMPAGFTIRSAQALRSRAATPSGTTGDTVNMGQLESVTIAPDRTSAYITLPRSEILSVKFIKE
jgi:O-glycosyl hydrolase